MLTDITKLKNCISFYNRIMYLKRNIKEILELKTKKIIFHKSRKGLSSLQNCFEQQKTIFFQNREYFIQITKFFNYLSNKLYYFKIENSKILKKKAIIMISNFIKSDTSFLKNIYSSINSYKTLIITILNFLKLDNGLRKSFSYNDIFLFYKIFLKKIKYQLSLKKSAIKFELYYFTKIFFLLLFREIFKYLSSIKKSILLVKKKDCFYNKFFSRNIIMLLKIYSNMTSLRECYGLDSIVSTSVKKVLQTHSTNKEETNRKILLKLIDKLILPKFFSKNYDKKITLFNNRRVNMNYYLSFKRIKIFETFRIEYFISFFKQNLKIQLHGKYRKLNELDDSSKRTKRISTKIYLFLYYKHEFLSKATFNTFSLYNNVLINFRLEIVKRITRLYTVLSRLYKITKLSIPFLFFRLGILKNLLPHFNTLNHKSKFISGSKRSMKLKLNYYLEYIAYFESINFFIKSSFLVNYMNLNETKIKIETKSQKSILECHISTYVNNFEKNNGYFFQLTKYYYNGLFLIVLLNSFKITFNIFSRNSNLLDKKYYSTIIRFILLSKKLNIHINHNFYVFHNQEQLFRCNLNRKNFKKNKHFLKYNNNFMFNNLSLIKFHSLCKSFITKEYYVCLHKMFSLETIDKLYLKKKAFHLQILINRIDYKAMSKIMLYKNSFYETSNRRTEKIQTSNKPNFYKTIYNFQIYLNIPNQLFLISKSNIRLNISLMQSIHYLYQNFSFYKIRILMQCSLINMNDYNKYFENNLLNQKNCELKNKDRPNKEISRFDFLKNHTIINYIKARNFLIKLITEHAYSKVYISLYRVLLIYFRLIVALIRPLYSFSNCDNTKTCLWIGFNENVINSSLHETVDTLSRHLEKNSSDFYEEIKHFSSRKDKKLLGMNKKKLYSLIKFNEDEITLEYKMSTSKYFRDLFIKLLYTKKLKKSFKITGFVAKTLSMIVKISRYFIYKKYILNQTIIKILKIHNEVLRNINQSSSPKLLYTNLKYIFLFFYPIKAYFLRYHNKLSIKTRLLKNQSYYILQIKLCSMILFTILKNSYKHNPYKLLKCFHEKLLYNLINYQKFKNYKFKNMNSNFNTFFQYSLKVLNKCFLVYIEYLFVKDNTFFRTNFKINSASMINISISLRNSIVEAQNYLSNRLILGFYNFVSTIKHFIKPYLNIYLADGCRLIGQRLNDSKSKKIRKNRKSISKNSLIFKLFIYNKYYEHMNKHRNSAFLNIAYRKYNKKKRLIIIKEHKKEKTNYHLDHLSLSDNSNFYRSIIKLSLIALSNVKPI